MFIIPLSPHEMIVISIENSMESKGLREMVSEINKTKVKYRGNLFYIVLFIFENSDRIEQRFGMHIPQRRS